MSRRKKETKVRQRDVFFTDLPEAIGSVQSGTRPVVIIQNDKLNQNSTTFVVAPITSKLKRLDLHEHVLLPKIKGLPKNSMVLAEQIQTISKEQLLYRTCRIKPDTFKQVKRAIRKCARVYKTGNYKITQKLL